MYFGNFSEHICELYGEQFLNRRPTSVELKEIVDIFTEKGFPGAAEYIDCMKIEWKNCPLTEKG